MAFHVGGLQGVAVEGGDEEVAFGEFVPKPLATGKGGHNGGDDFLALTVGKARLFFEAADVFAIGGVGGHQWTV